MAPWMFITEAHVFDLYPRHSHRTPQQIAEDAGGSFEPRRTNRESTAAASPRARASDFSRDGTQDEPATDRPSGKLER
jgi:hypothetical protein